MSLRRSPRIAAAAKPMALYVSPAKSKSVEPLRRSARLAEKAMLAEKAPVVNPEPAVKLTPIPLWVNVLHILIKFADNACNAEKENALITLFRYFQENMENIQTRSGCKVLIEIYKEKLALAKSVYPENSELQAL